MTGLIGRGGMGIVYSGVHPVIGKRVAIKVLSREFADDNDLVARFVQEARAVNKIQHDSIIDIFAFGHEPAIGHYFVMPHLPGRSLAARLAQDGPMSLEHALPVIGKIAGALDAAHAARVFHRDLKPDNVFLVDETPRAPIIKVLDFGIAKLIEGGGMLATRTGVQMGTPLFMSPEQWDAHGIDHRTDVYALGVLIHHVLTGRFPFESRSPLALMNMHVNQDPMPPSKYGAPTAVDPVVARALAKHKDDRFSSAGALFDALSVAVEQTETAGRTAVAPPPSTSSLSVMATLESGAAEGTPSQIPRTGGWRWPMVIVFVAAVVGVAGMFAIAPWRGDPAQQPVTIDAPVRDAVVTHVADASADAVAPQDSVVDSQQPTSAKRRYDAGLTATKKSRRTGGRVDRGSKPVKPPPPPSRPSGEKPGKTNWGEPVNPF